MRCLTLFAGVCLLVGCADEPIVLDDGQEQADAEGEAKEGGKISLSNPKMTDKIGKFDPTAGRKVSNSKGTYSNPLTGALEMYGPTVERLSKMGIDRAVGLFHAEHGRYPKDYDEFMSRIIKANNIKLPVLPGQLEYQYDEENHKLVVVEKQKAQ